MSFLVRTQLTINKNIKMSSFNSSENIRKKEGGPNGPMSNNELSSVLVSLNKLGMKARESML